MLDERGVVVRFLSGRKDFSQAQRVYAGPGAYPPSYSSVGTVGAFPGCKQPRREPNSFSPSNAEFENLLTYNSTPAHAFMKLTGAALLPPVH
jgi:hypothetical protein